MDEIKSYLRQIGDYPVLTREQETALFETMRGNDKAKAEKARDTLAKCNLKLVFANAKKYANCGVALADLVQEGNMGLVKAMDRFDLSMGLKFSTYATWWIRQGLTRYVKKHSKTVFIPEHLMNMTIKVKRTERELGQELGRKPTLAEIAKKAKVTVQQVKDSMEYAQQNVSLQTKVGEDSTEYGDLLPDMASTDPAQKTSDDIVREHLAQCLDALSPREREIIEYRYGIGAVAYTAEQLAKKWNVAVSRVEELTRKAFESLRLEKEDLPAWALA